MTDQPTVLPTMATLAIFALIAAYMYAVTNPTPIVQKAHPSGECVRVIPERAGDCENLPPKYDTEWVSPKVQQYSGVPG